MIGFVPHSSKTSTSSQSLVRNWLQMTTMRQLEQSRMKKDDDVGPTKTAVSLHASIMTLSMWSSR